MGAPAGIGLLQGLASRAHGPSGSSPIAGPVLADPRLDDLGVHRTHLQRVRRLGKPRCREITEALPADPERYPPGRRVDSKWRGRTVHFTKLMQEALPIVRGVLILALRGETITYKELSTTIDQRYHYRQLGDLLDVVSQDCFDHEEPSLAALVTRGDTSQLGDAFIGDAKAEREACQ